MLTNMAAPPVFVSHGRVLGLFLLLFVLSDQRRRTNGHTVDNPTALDGSIDRDNGYIVENQKDEIRYLQGYTSGLVRNIQPPAHGRNVLSGGVAAPGVFPSRSSTSSKQPGHYPAKYESVQRDESHETGESLPFADKQYLVGSKQSFKERDTQSDYGFALANRASALPIFSSEKTSLPNKATRDGSSGKKTVASTSKSIHDVLSAPAKGGEEYKHYKSPGPSPRNSDWDGHVAKVAPSERATGIHVQSRARYNLQQDGLTGHVEPSSSQPVETLIKDTDMTPSHILGLHSTGSSPLNSQWFSNQIGPQIGNSHRPLGNLLRRVPIFDAQQAIANRKSSDIIDERKIYPIPGHNSANKQYMSEKGEGHLRPHSEMFGSMESRRLAGVSQVDRWGYSTPDDDKVSDKNQQRRFRRDKRQISLFASQIQSEDEGLEPDEPEDVKLQSKDNPTTSDNISESALSYRSKGKMAYIDTPRTRLKTSLDLREPPANGPAPDSAGNEPSSNETAIGNGVSSNVSTENSERVIHVGVALGSESDLANMNASSEPETENEPEVEPDSEAEPEAESEPEGETSGGGTSEPETNADGCSNRLCYAEPYPDWEIAKPMYGGAWEFHVYAIGIAFGILAIYTFASMLVLRQKANLLSKGYFMSLNSLLLLMGTTRSIYLLVDGYDSLRIFHPVVSYILINMSFPCLTSAFSILFLAMLRATKMQIVSRKIQKVGVLIGIIVFHFVLSITVDIIVGFVLDLRVLFLVCQVTFIVWGVFLFCGYFYLFWKLYHSPSVDYAVRESTRQSNYTHGADPQRQESTAEPRSTKMTKLKSFHTKVMLNLALKVTLSTAFLGVAYIVVVIYGMVDVFNIFATDPPEPWPFWAYHFCIRVIELSMCGAMSFVATQPLRYNRSSKSTAGDSGCHEVLYFVPCYRSCMERGDKHNSSGDKCSAGVLSHTDSDAPGADGAWSSPLNDLSPRTPMMAQVLTPEPGGAQGGSGRSGRPSSMLYYDSGLVRFRQEGDSDGDPVGASTDEELDCPGPGPGPYHHHRVRRVAPSEMSPIANGDTSYACQHNGSVERFVLPQSNGGRMPANWRYGSRKSTTSGRFMGGCNTPGTPLSLCSTDFDVTSGDFNFRPPSSIHLRDSIDRALNYSDLHLRTPDCLQALDSISLPESPDALRNSLYSYATANQDSKSGTMSASPGRILHSAQSLRASSPSLSCRSYKTPEVSRSDWFQRYFWGKFANKHAKSQATSAENSIDANLPDKCGNKFYSPLSTYAREGSLNNLDNDVTLV